MAADILIHNADIVPVGEDNRQHIEITRDVATAFNGHYGDVFSVPTGRIEDRVAVVPGTDGRKMSKSYRNVVPIFGQRDEVARRIKGIVTDSRRPDEPKDPESCNVFALYRLVATEAAVAELAQISIRFGRIRRRKGVTDRGARTPLRRCPSAVS